MWSFGNMWSFGKTWSELEKGGVSKEMADIGHRINGHNAHCTRPKSVFLQCKLVSG